MRLNRRNMALFLPLAVYIAALAQPNTASRVFPCDEHQHAHGAGKGHVAMLCALSSQAGSRVTDTAQPAARHRPLDASATACLACACRVQTRTAWWKRHQAW